LIELRLNNIKLENKNILLLTNLKKVISYLKQEALYNRQYKEIGLTRLKAISLV
jgi:hypothetical protein